jgi:hypothetical protein
MEGSLGQSKATPQVWFHFSSAGPGRGAGGPHALDAYESALPFDFCDQGSLSTDISANRKHITVRKRFRRNKWSS